MNFSVKSAKERGVKEAARKYAIRLERDRLAAKSAVPANNDRDTLLKYGAALLVGIVIYKLIK